MTDPSLYQFSDAFLNALQNAQEQPIQDDSYYPDDSQQVQQDDGTDYQSMYDDLNQKYEDQSTLLQQLQDQFQEFSSRPQYQESIYSEGDPNYSMDFVSRNVLGLDNSGSSDYSKFQTFDTPEEGRNALIHQLDLYQTGRTHNPVKPSSTLQEAMSVYAPASDHNNPEAYADFIAKQIGVTPDTPIANIDTEKWADAITKFEGNTQGNNPGNLEKYSIGGKYKVY